MAAHPPFRKVLDGVATREQMFQLFSRHKDTPGIATQTPRPGGPNIAANARFS
ncbi:MULTISPECIES: DUF1419 domain-containing protein [Mesorhizobium]|uniref:Uncharacterized protein n=1 Tax=Mesorhizobium qingshengii TaxID=1165689 RepID=A0A1G5ZUT1_9HYPH|nr:MULTISPECIES: DUF1419 domain-containing protein [Mesorhizobium]MCH4560547.1 DUF1419 domain-containing protein [Mesorhizobium jarvisii]SDA98445.1 Protein of unknown function [Mesorhizobium qingshengii]